LDAGIQRGSWRPAPRLSIRAGLTALVQGGKVFLMTCLRRVLAPLTAIWLCCQVGAVALVPVGLRAPAADPHAVQCVCGHGPAALCRMHHKPAGESPCVMRAATSSDGAVLTNLIGTTGLIGQPTRAIQPAVPTTRPLAGDVYSAGERPIPPDPPPPRV